MDTQEAYRLAVQAAVAAALRELMRIEREQNPMTDALSIDINLEGGIDVHLLNSSRMGMEGYSL